MKCMSKVTCSRMKCMSKVHW